MIQRGCGRKRRPAATALGGDGGNPSSVSAADRVLATPIKLRRRRSICYTDLPYTTRRKTNPQQIKWSLGVISITAPGKPGKVAQ